MNAVRIGILGCARIAKPALIDAACGVEDLEIAAVASRDLARSRDFAAAHAIPRAYGDYAALLADPEIDAIYNPLPNALHADWTIRALEAGKAVLCEKPLAANADAAMRMVEAAKVCGRPLMEAFHYRHHPLMRFVEAMVADGGLGRIREVDVGFEVPGALVAADDIRFQAQLAGGAAMDVGAYCVNALRHVAGAHLRVLDADATLVGPDVDGAMVATFETPGGARGRMSCSLVAAEFRAWLRVDGEHGRLSVENPFLPQMGHGLEIERDGATERRSFDPTSTYVFQARAFVDVMRGGACLTSGQDGVANMRTIDRVYEAAGLDPRG